MEQIRQILAQALDEACLPQNDGTGNDTAILISAVQMAIHEIDKMKGGVK